MSRQTSDHKVSNEHQKFLNEFDRNLEKGLVEVIDQAEKSENGTIAGYDDLIKQKLKEVYSIAWNKYADKIGLDNLKLDTECQLIGDSNISEDDPNTPPQHILDRLNNVEKELNQIAKDLHNDINPVVKTHGMGFDAANNSAKKI